MTENHSPDVWGRPTRQGVKTLSDNDSPLDNQTLWDKRRIIDSEASGWADDIKNKMVFPEKDVREALKEFLKIMIYTTKDGKKHLFEFEDVKRFEEIIKSVFGEEMMK